MPRLLRLFCLLLAVAFGAAMTPYGPADARDQAEHLEHGVAALHGVDVSGHSHSDSAEAGPDDQPASGQHHHHGGADHSFALSDKPGLAPALTTSLAELGWPQGLAPDDLAPPGPDQPPKRTPTVS